MPESDVAYFPYPLGFRIVIIQETELRKKTTGGRSSSRTLDNLRRAGSVFSVGTEVGERLATVSVEQKDSNHSTDPRTIYLAVAVGSSITLQEVVRPPITDEDRLRGLALHFAEAAIVSQAIVNQARAPN
jgi:hypothetical protein